MTPVEIANQIQATHHATLRQEVAQLGDSFRFSQKTPRLLAPWKHFENAVQNHLVHQETIFFPALVTLSKNGDMNGLPKLLDTVENDLQTLATLEDALRAAAPEADKEETRLLTLLDDLSKHLQRESTEICIPLRSLVTEKDRKARIAATQKLLRETTGVCTKCLKRVPARVLVSSENVVLEKTCPTDGTEQEPISDNPKYWAELDSYYFRVNDQEYPQRDFIVRMTEDCNLDCPICLAKANTEDTQDLDLSGLEKLISERRGIKIDLMAAEPTLRKDLEDWIRKVKLSGNIAALHTNGLKLAKREYAERIKAAGIDEVFLQFDGFDDNAHLVLRGRKLIKARMAALKNLRELNIATSLIVVIAKDLNEAEVKNTFQFAAEPENAHIREVFFMGLRLLGSARDQVTRDTGSTLSERRLMPDDLITLFTEQNPNIRRQDILNFNKLYFALLSAFKVKKCLYIQHYLLLRGSNGSVTPISEIVNLERLGKAADDYAHNRLKHPRVAKARFLSRLTLLFANRKAAAHGLDLIRLQMLFKTGMNLKDVPNSLLLLGFITACDPHNFDADVAINCGKGELSVDGGFTESSAVANVDREARFAISARLPGKKSQDSAT